MALPGSFPFNGWCYAMSEQERPEKGGMLLELLIALPLILFLTMSLCMAFSSFLKAYLLVSREWELQQELRVCMERMVQDIKLAEDVCIEGDERPSLGYTRHTAQGDILQGYYIIYPGVPGCMKKMKADGYGAPQPMTGGSWPGRVSVTAACYEIRDGRLFIVLRGRELDSSLELELSTAIALPMRMRGESDDTGSR